MKGCTVDREQGKRGCCAVDLVTVVVAINWHASCH